MDPHWGGSTPVNRLEVKVPKHAPLKILRVPRARPSARGAKNPKAKGVSTKGRHCVVSHPAGYEGVCRGRLDASRACRVEDLSSFL